MTGPATAPVLRDALRLLGAAVLTGLLTSVAPGGDRYRAGLRRTPVPGVVAQMN